jgi:hypothetical protein
VIQADGFVDFGCASEFPHPDHEGFVQHAALLEIFEEGGKDVVRDG